MKVRPTDLYVAGGYAVSGGDLSRKRRVAIKEPSLLFGRVLGQALIASGDPIGRCEIGREMFAVDFPAEHETPRLFEG